MSGRIAIVAGGGSSEHHISLRSAETVKNSLTQRYDVRIIVIDGGNWYWKSEKGRLFPIDKNDFSLIVDHEKIRFDAVFIAIHGNPGENGKLQGYFDMIEMPYTGSNLLAAATTFSKQTCKDILSHHNIPMAPSRLVKRDEVTDSSTMLRDIGLPCFVKPNESGSSFGITRVTSEQQLQEALTKAFSESPGVLIESEIRGTEVTCSVMKSSRRTILFPVTEIRSKNEFFDYEAKYDPVMCDEITPAEIPDSEADLVKRYSSEIYDHLNCSGLVRVDFIISDGIPFFLEVNIIPGMTPESLLPQQAEVMGIEPGEIYAELIEDLLRDLP